MGTWHIDPYDACAATPKSRDIPYGWAERGEWNHSLTMHC